MKRILLCLVSVGLSVYTASARFRMHEDGNMVLSSAEPVSIVIDDDDAEVVKIASGMLADDMFRICGAEVTLSSDVSVRDGVVIIAGTVDGSRYIRELERTGKIDVSAIKGGWERYSVRWVKRPFPGIRDAVVIAGSDRRGAAYGILSLSDALGVSPWVWWADVPYPKMQKAAVAVEDSDSKSPSVRYRGIFINDEDWGLLPWASETFEPEVGSIGPKTYTKVFELMLRLKANYLCPAMHRRSMAFNEHPDNKILADRYAIVMGSVHCEPLLYNNAREWDKTVMGAWNYVTNKEVIDSVLRDRVRNNGAYENVYTLALRGLHDKAMEGSEDMETRRRILEAALADQRCILSDLIPVPVEEIPQAFTPYKEVLELYEMGMEIPEDVTIVWPDDNYGYMKRLSGPEERRRKGRSGVYYHVSYHGKPHDYLWLCTTPPSLMYEELDKAYRTGADRIWLLNAGDIKSCEYAVDLFMRMAFDFEAFDFDKAAHDNAEWLAGIFGMEHKDSFDVLMDGYYRLAFSAKPEYMGWGQEWNTKMDKQAKVTDTDFSFTAYSEAQNRLRAYDELGVLADSIAARIPQEYSDAFFELVQYPVHGASMMNRMHLSSQKSRLYARQGRASAVLPADLAYESYDSLQRLTDRYDSLLNGKWKGVVSLEQGVTANYFKRPALERKTVAGPPSLGICVMDDAQGKGMGSWNALPCFNRYLPGTYSFDIFNRGEGKIKWRLEMSDDWILADVVRGETEYESQVNVSVDWRRVPFGEKVKGVIKVVSDAGTGHVLVSVFNPSMPLAEDIEGLYVEDNGCISIPAAGYHDKHENCGIRMRVIDNLGVENKAVQIGDPLLPPQDLRDTVSWLRYDFHCFNSGSADVYIYVLPTFPLYERKSFGGDFAGYEHSSGELKFGVSIDDAMVTAPSIPSHEYAQAWTDNVLRNCHVSKVTMNVRSPGRHWLKILCGDPGVVIQKIVIDFGGMRRSLAGPPSTLATDVMEMPARGMAHVGNAVLSEDGILGTLCMRSRNGRLSAFITSRTSPAVTMFNPEMHGNGGGWRGEHLGKWLYAAAKAAERYSDEAMRARVKDVADHVLEVMDENGWAGCFREERRYYMLEEDGTQTLGWDLWINSYLMSGLLCVYDLTDDPRYLDAACLMADLMYDTFVVRGLSVVQSGHHAGLVGLSTLEALVHLYSRRPEERYRMLMDRCVAEAEDGPGLQMLTKILSGTDMSAIGDGKIYEMLRLLTGLAGYSVLTGSDVVHSVCVKAWKMIKTYHLSPGGCPWGGVNVNEEVFNRKECFSPYCVCETCSAMQWLRFTWEMLAATGRAEYAEELENTLYNALAGAMQGDGWVYYTRLNGAVWPGNEWSCCWSSGMMAMEDMVDMVYGVSGSQVYVNIYTPSAAMVDVSGAGCVRIAQEHSYPRQGKIVLKVDGDGRFCLNLRSPAYASGLSVKVNGNDADCSSEDGWLRLERRWKKGDTVTLSVDMDVYLSEAVRKYDNDGKFSIRDMDVEEKYAAFRRGPLLYAADHADEMKAPSQLVFSGDVGSDVDYVEDGLIVNLNAGPLLFRPFYSFALEPGSGFRTVWVRME